MRVLRFLVILAITLAVTMYIRSHRRDSTKPELVDAVAGDRICRPDGKAWGPAGSGALVIVTSPTCGACTASKDFSDELYTYGQAHHIPVIFAIGEKPGYDEGSAALALSGKTVIRVRLPKFGITQEPTFLRVDHRGVIQSKWTGTLYPSDHDRVFNSIVSGTGLENYKTIPASEMDTYLNRADIQILALAGAAKRPRTKVIPAEELDIRARFELKPELTTLVDCSSAPVLRQCQYAALDLVRLEFKDVIAVGLPRYLGVCD